MEYGARAIRLRILLPARCAISSCEASCGENGTLAVPGGVRINPLWSRLRLKHSHNYCGV
jgi:hypothetical protein